MEKIAIIRISGLVKMRRDMEETLSRLRLRKKYVCVVVNPTSENMGMIRKIENFVAYGKINPETLEKLIEKRGQQTNKKKIDAKKAAEELIKGKDYEELNLKPFFRLHPPRKGIDSKKHFGTSSKGVLGDNKEKINDLILRML
ncbi:uL30 family ribosomal protein [Candidatus Pacearchaeota archaeon]|nr:uL30 family ribosomal protein [Candidatus Pacearchaeota archaeon]